MTISLCWEPPGNRAGGNFTGKNEYLRRKEAWLRTRHGSRKVFSNTLNALTSNSDDTDELAATGLRHVGQRSEPVPADEGPESELPVPAGELLAGRYSVERIFAEGGMGVVCLGRHAQLEQPVAIKFLRRALAGKPQVVERFLNEGRALAALRSEHVVRVMDVGQLESGRPYLVMEHLEGIDLDALVDRDGPLSVETAVSYALQVCEPLAEAHGLGIVHRDIKPENLFLWSGGPGVDIVKVLDFGLAKQFGAPRSKAVTGPQDSMGSPCYMSPEQITTPQSIDARTDIWSVGVVLHRLLTDTLPFDGNSILEVLSHVLSAPPMSLHEARPELTFDPELEAIVHRCLDKSPAARFATMGELAEALTAYLAQRSAGTVAHEPRLPTPVPARRLAQRSVPARDFEGDDAKIRIEGVHSRWPGALLLLALGIAAAALYQADRTGKIRIRDLSDHFTFARRHADAPRAPTRDHEYLLPALSGGVIANDATREANGVRALRAEPERDAYPASAGASEPDPTVPLSAEERARKEAAYRDYLKSEGLTPLSEALPASEAADAADAPPAAN